MVYLLISICTCNWWQYFTYNSSLLYSLIGILSKTVYPSFSVHQNHKSSHHHLQFNVLSLLSLVLQDCFCVAMQHACTTNICLFLLDAWLNVRSQISHLNGRSPVWIMWCLSTAAFELKLLLQNSQGYTLGISLT